MCIEVDGVKALLVEVKLQHLMQSKVFRSFFLQQPDLDEERKINPIIQNFYVVEGESLFSVPPQFYNFQSAFQKTSSDSTLLS